MVQGRAKAKVAEEDEEAVPMNLLARQRLDQMRWQRWCRHSPFQPCPQMRQVRTEGVEEGEAAGARDGVKAGAAGA